MDYIYSISDLRKEYNGRTVLNIKELNIAAGEITTIIGPSGSGKSTLLNLMNHIELPTSGYIVFNGYQYPHNSAISMKVRRDMGAVFQKPILFKGNVYENIAYGLKLRQISKQQIKKKVEEIVELIGLKDMLLLNAKTLSGGEAQRVAIARAIIINPRVLLMDEVTTNLDPSNVILIENLIKYANLNYKTSIIMATHNMKQAERLSDKIAFLLNGSLIEYGEAKTLLEKPKNDITKAFINGDMVY
jgi:tungstate transport system ATP-binding protein